MNGPPTEEAVVGRTREPMTVAALVRDLDALGVRQGDVLLVHSSLSALGWVCGGAQAVVLALEEALGTHGTLVMPSHSGQFTDPSGWGDPAVPEAWWDTIRACTPAFDPAFTPTRGMGAVVECFRGQAGVLRSGHPTVSFAARGVHAARITSSHPYDDALGDASPLGALYELDARVLLLGVGHARNTSLHLAEYRARWPGRRAVIERLPVTRDGVTRYEAFRDVARRDALFPRIGAAFDVERGLTRCDKVGAADARFMPQRELVDYAVGFLESGRAPVSPD